MPFTEPVFSVGRILPTTHYSLHQNASFRTNNRYTQQGNPVPLHFNGSIRPGHLTCLKLLGTEYMVNFMANMMSFSFTFLHFQGTWLDERPPVAEPDPMQSRPNIPPLRQLYFLNNTFISSISCIRFKFS